MAEQPWFKFFAADYLLDPDVDALPREAEALLVRMWCICHREGSCPSDVESLARKTLCNSTYVSQHKPNCERFFELRDGRLYSRRMEDEKIRSEQARENANKRYARKSKPNTKSESKTESESESESEHGSAIGTAIRTANGSAKSNPDGFDQILGEVFSYYLERTDRNPKTYSFTATRKRQGHTRLKECLKKTSGDLEKAAELMRLAIDGLAASAFHMGRDSKTNGQRYCEWEKHLFKTYEQMERWWNSNGVPK